MSLPRSPVATSWSMPKSDNLDFLRFSGHRDDQEPVPSLTPVGPPHKRSASEPGHFYGPPHLTSEPQLRSSRRFSNLELTALWAIDSIIVFRLYAFASNPI